MKERKDRVEDALHATRAAVEEGIVAGGGTTLLRCIDAVEAVRGKVKGDAKFGVDLVAAALKAPTATLASNAGHDGSAVVEEVLDRKGWVGFEALAGEYTDLGQAGIVDPAKVVRVALQNAGSIAGLLLTTNTLVTDVRDNEIVAGAVS